MKTLNFMLIGLAIASLSSCSSETESINPEEQQEEQQEEVVNESGIVKLSGIETLSILNEPEYIDYIELSSEEEVLNKNINKFAFDMFKSMSTESYTDRNGNFFVSPISVTLFLGVQANTFDAASSQKVMSALNCDNLGIYNSLSKKLMSYLPNPAIGSDMTIANSVWFNSSLQYDQDYLEKIIDAYNAEIYLIDTDGEKHLQSYVDEWCNQKTKGLIKDFSTDGYFTYGYLALNAIYYNGEWESKFDVQKTDVSDFNGTNGKTSVDMMHNTIEGQYAETDEYNAIRLPYKGTNEMIVIQAKDGSAINSIGTSFSYEEMEQLLSKFKYYEVELSLPKVKFEEEEVLTDVLNDLGIPYKNIIPEKLGINKPCGIGTAQKTYSSIDEEGTTIAAITGGYVIVNNGDETEKLEHVVMNVNSPFLFFVRNKVTGSILMAGRICNI